MVVSNTKPTGSPSVEYTYIATDTCPRTERGQPCPAHACDPVLSPGRWEAPSSTCCDDLFSQEGGRNIKADTDGAGARQVVAGALQMRRLVSASLIALMIGAGPALAQPSGTPSRPPGGTAPAPPAPTPPGPPPTTNPPPATTPPVVTTPPPETTASRGAARQPASAAARGPAAGPDRAVADRALSERPRRPGQFRQRRQ